MKLKRPRLSENALLTGVLARLRAEFDSRLRDPAALKIAFVLGDMKAIAENVAMIELANALSAEHTVLLCNAQPGVLDESLVCRMDSRLIPLEGTVGMTYWGSDLSLSLAPGDRDGDRRPSVFRELIRILRIDVVHSYSLAADRLVLAAGSGQSIPWLVHPKSHTSDLAATSDSIAQEGLVAPILKQARGYFALENDEVWPQDETMSAAIAEKPRWILAKNSSIDQIAATCGEAYVEMTNRIAFPHEAENDSSDVGQRLSLSRRRPA